MKAILKARKQMGKHGGALHNKSFKGIKDIRFSKFKIKKERQN